MKTPAQIFKDRPELLEHSPVQELIREYQEVCDQLIDLEQVSGMSKERPLKILVREIQESIARTRKHNEEADRFGYEDKIDYEKAVTNLQRYISKYLRDHYIYL